MTRKKKKRTKFYNPKTGCWYYQRGGKIYKVVCKKRRRRR